MGNTQAKDSQFVQEYTNATDFANYKKSVDDSMAKINTSMSGINTLATASDSSIKQINASIDALNSMVKNQAISTRVIGTPDGGNNFWIGLNGSAPEVDRLAIAISGDPKTGVVNQVYIPKKTVYNGDLISNGNVFMKGGSSDMNPDNWQTHFPYPGDNKNYIRGDLEIRGHTNQMGNLTVGKGLNVSGSISGDTIINRNTDFLLGSSDGGADNKGGRGNYANKMANGRALVKDAITNADGTKSPQLVVNYGADFPSGTRVDGPLKSGNYGGTHLEVANNAAGWPNGTSKILETKYDDQDNLNIYVPGSTRSKPIARLRTEGTIDLGLNDDKREINSGKIAYGLCDANALSIVGKGTNTTDRLVRVHDNATIGRDLNVGNNVSVQGRVWSGGPGSGGIWVDGQKASGQFVGSVDPNSMGFYNNGDWRLWHNKVSNVVNANGGLAVNSDNVISHRGLDDKSQGLTWAYNRSFKNNIAAKSVDGPVLSGWNGGLLGTNDSSSNGGFSSDGTSNWALRWDNKGDVSLNGATNITMVGLLLLKISILKIISVLVKMIKC